MYLLMFLAFLDCKMPYILLIILLPISKKLVTIILKSLCKVLRATTIAIIPQKS